MQDDSKFDPREYRNALGTYITGVTIITTRTQEGNPTGLTVNSFNSVSLEPPMVLWSLSKESSNLSAFEQSEYWAVHILSVDQEELSNLFAKKGINKFEGINWEEGIGGIPMLNNCSSILQCKTAFKYEGGDHIIFVGKVINFIRTDAIPLVFHAGKYAVATRKLDDISKSTDRLKPVIDSRFEDGFIGYLLLRASHHFLELLGQVDEIKQSGFSREERVFMNILCLNDPMSLDRINKLIVPHNHITPDIVHNFKERGIIKISKKGTSTVYSLTKQGRDTALHLLAAAKSLESEIFDKIGYWEAQSLKNLLKQLILLSAPENNN